MAATAGALPEAPRPPGWARALGYAGLVPFVGGAALLALAGAELRPQAAFALAAYAALILSFLGGIHWGLAFRQARPSPALFAWGVSPSLIAWAALLLPAPAGLALLAALVVLCYAVDRQVYPRQGAAAWLGLRLQLSTVAALSCAAGAALA